MSSAIQWCVVKTLGNSSISKLIIATFLGTSSKGPSTSANSSLMSWLVNFGTELLLRWGGVSLEQIDFCSSEEWLILHA